MKTVEIYTTPTCPYCLAAKRLLAKKGAAFTEIDVSRDPALRDAMTVRANGSRSVPQIFIGGTHVGGSDDIHALDHEGRLDPMLANQAMRAGLVQLNVNDDPAANLPETIALIRAAATGGAGFVLTPECTNGLSSSRDHQNAVFHHEDDDPTLAALRAEAKAAKIWLLIGSLGLKTHDADGRFANRSFLITPEGDIAARYDKIHMFDVNVSETEVYRESAGYRPGTKAVVADTPFARIGMTVCYDVRFPHLYRALAQGGAQIITVPAAFNHLTGQAHWETLLRARAIESGCFILAPAQTGHHPESNGKGRQTHGHSLAIAPWGEILADAGKKPGVTFVDLDLGQVAKARARVPSLTHDRPFDGP